MKNEVDFYILHPAFDIFESIQINITPDASAAKAMTGRIAVPSQIDRPVGAVSTHTATNITIWAAFKGQWAARGRCAIDIARSTNKTSMVV